MNTPPAASDLDLEALTRLVSTHWDIQATELSYLKLGFGSHHWLVEGADAQPVFLTVDDVGQRPEREQTLVRAMTTAWHLANSAGIEAVVAPIASSNGELVVMLGERWAVTVFPHLPVEPSQWGRFTSADEADEVQRVIARIHAVQSPVVPVGIPPQETFAIQQRTQLFERLDNVTTPWTSGPYGEPTRVVLERHADQIRAAFAHYDALVADTVSGRGDWVITYGEPHAGNVVRRSDTGEFVLVDWDTCALAPRERDVWQLFPDGDRSPCKLGGYLQEAGVTVEAISPDRLDLYRLRWDLEEIANYASWFSQLHTATEDTRTAWNGFAHSVALLAEHLETV